MVFKGVSGVCKGFMVFFGVVLVFQVFKVFSRFFKGFSGLFHLDESGFVSMQIYVFLTFYALCMTLVLVLI